MLKRQHVVVGVSRTPPGEAALRWALGIGLAQDWEVMAVHAFDADTRTDATLEPDRGAAARESAHRAQGWVQEVAGDDRRRRILTFTSEADSIENLLAKYARGATLLVLGAPTSDPHAALPENLRRRCSCPVVVVGESGAASVQTESGLDSVPGSSTLVG
jgi:nucleotide-binding universal stress UspA family protein